MRAIKLRATANEKQITENTQVRVVYNVGVSHYMRSERLEIRILNIEPV